MNKNTVIAMVLSGLVIAAAMFVQYKFFPPVPVSEQPSTAAAKHLCRGNCACRFRGVGNSGRNR